MKQRVVSLMLVAAFVAGCATHDARARAAWDSPTSTDGRVIRADDEKGAVVANIWYAPGHALLCAGAGIISGLDLFLTWGQSYESASQIMHASCSEPWILHPSDIRQAVP
jgi:hypothetical protein